MASISVPDLICNSMEIDWSEPFSTKACRLFLLRICPLCWNCVFWFKADSSATAARASNALSLFQPYDNLQSSMLILNKCQLLSDICLFKPGPFPSQPTSSGHEALSTDKSAICKTCSIILSFMHEMKRGWTKSLCFLIIDL